VGASIAAGPIAPEPPGVLDRGCPGTTAEFSASSAIKDEQEISDLWAYLKQFDANGNIKK
jgi:hypothetical protein